MLSKVLPLRYPEKKTDQVRLVDRTSGTFNISYSGIKWRSLFHLLIDVRWSYFLLYVAIYYATIHFIFGSLYYSTGYGAVQSSLSYWDFFFFSVQTMETIGYGYLAPTKGSSNAIVVVQVFLGFLMTAFITAIVYARISRPSQLRRTLHWSTVAVINYDNIRFVCKNIDELEDGRYRPGKKSSLVNKHIDSVEMGHNIYEGHEEDDASCPVLIFRVGNPHKSQALDPRLKLFLLRRKNTELGERQLESDQEDNLFGPWADDYVIEEMSFEIYRQKGRARSLGISCPTLGLPWTIVHPMNRHSPLYKATPESLVDMQAEVIAIFDGVNESVASNIQARWSYIPSEIVWNARFLPIVHVSQKERKFVVDYTKISKYTQLEETNSY